MTALELIARSVSIINDSLGVIEENMAELSTGQDAVPIPADLSTAGMEAEASVDSLRRRKLSWANEIADHHSFTPAQIWPIGQEFRRSETGNQPGQSSGQLPMADQPGQPLQEQEAAPTIAKAKSVSGFGQPPGPRPTRSHSIGPQRGTAAARSTTQGPPSGLPMQRLGPFLRAPPSRPGQLPPGQTISAEPGSTTTGVPKAPPAILRGQSSAEWADA